MLQYINDDCTLIAVNTSSRQIHDIVVRKHTAFPIYSASPVYYDVAKFPINVTKYNVVVAMYKLLYFRQNSVNLLFTIIVGLI